MLKKRYTRPITITVEDVVYEKMKDITDKDEISISEYIREAINFRLFQEMGEIDPEDN